MKKVIVGADSEGIECICLKKTFLIKDFIKVCEKIESKLQKEGFKVTAEFSINKSHMVLDISVLDDEFDTIGVVEYICEELGETEYYQLNCIKTNAANKDCAGEQWDNYYGYIDELVRGLL